MAGKNGKVKHAFKAGIKGFAGQMTAEEAAAVALDAGVAYVEQDQAVTLGVAKPVSGGSGGGKNKTTTPGGTLIQNSLASWGLDRVDQAALPMSSGYSYTAIGAGVNAYIIDSGITITHAAFEGRGSG